MAEIIFILVTFYVAYVIHTVYAGEPDKNVAKASPIPLVPTANPVVKREKKAVVAKKTAIQKNKSANTRAVKSSSSKATEANTNLRNPETGEVAKIASSYRMCKRWIKDALVSEGLLEKIYKTSELDDSVKVKINHALEQLSRMEKYQ